MLVLSLPNNLEKLESDCTENLMVLPVHSNIQRGYHMSIPSGRASSIPLGFKKKM